MNERERAEALYNEVVMHFGSFNAEAAIQAIMQELRAAEDEGRMAAEADRA